MLYELARAAILKRVAEVCRDLRKAEEQSEVARGAELRTERVALWQELYELPAHKPRTCASVVRKYSASMVAAQGVLRDLNKLRTS